MKTSDQINEICKALSSAQGDMKPAKKDSTNPHFKSKFSSFTSVWESIRQPLTQNGLTVLQDITTSPLEISVTTRLCHLSGQWIEFGPISITVASKNAHAVGSAVSYGKRYSLCAALGVVSHDDDIDCVEDDDGNAASESISPIKKNKEKEELITKEQVDEILEYLYNFEPISRKTMFDRILLGAGGKELAFMPASKFKSCMDFLEKELNKINTKEQG